MDLNTTDNTTRHIPKDEKTTIPASPEDSKEEIEIDVSVRYSLSLCVFWLYTLRFDLPIALLVMTDASYAETENSNVSTQEPNEWQWDQLTQGLILSSFFWGYVPAQIFTGILINRLPRNHIPGIYALWPSAATIACGSLALLNLILNAHGDWQIFCASRALMGFFQGIAIPIIYKILVHVTTEEQQNAGFVMWHKIMSAAYLTPIISVFLMRNRGWPLVFSFFGMLTVLIGILSIFVVREKSLAKFSTIENSTAGSVETRLDQIPWKSIFSSRGFWAIFASNVCQTWCFWLLATQIPSYLKHVVGFPLVSNGSAMAVFYSLGALITALVLYLSDSKFTKRYKKCLPRILSRKLFNSLGFWIPAAILILLGALPDKTKWLNFSLLIIGIGSNSFMISGYQKNAHDLSKNFAGSINGVTNIVANCFALTAPIIASLVVSDPTSFHQWGVLLYVTAAIYIAGNVIFVIFASGVRQDWDKRNEIIL